MYEVISSRISGHGFTPEWRQKVVISNETLTTTM